MAIQVPLNLYQVLGLKDFVGFDSIRSAFKKLALKFHPDRPGGDEEKMKAINSAYGFLRENKQKYDAFLKEKKYDQPVRGMRYSFAQNIWMDPNWDMNANSTTTSTTGTTGW